MRKLINDSVIIDALYRAGPKTGKRMRFIGELGLKKIGS
jgi:hypothetical protein